MKGASFIRELLLWFLAAGAVVAAFFAALYFGLFVLILSPFPRDLAEPTAGFTMGLLVVFAGAFLAPRWRLIIGIILLVANAIFVATFLKLQFLSTLVGGIVAVVFIGWWFSSKRTRGSIKKFGLGVGIALFVFSGVVYARFVDIPAIPKGLNSELAYALGTNASQVHAFYCYDQGGFIDHEWLWRIDAPPETIALVVSRLEMRSTNTVPQSFWKMPPYYWPRSMPSGGEAFQNSLFTGDKRGPDGTYHFLVHDKIQNRAFVWVKDNF